MLDQDAVGRAQPHEPYHPKASEAVDLDMTLSWLKWIGWQALVWGTRIVCLVAGMFLFDYLHDRQFTAEQVAKGCVKIGRAGVVTEITPGVSVSGPVWFCKEKDGK